MLARIGLESDQYSPYLENGFEALSMSHSSETKIYCTSLVSRSRNWFDDKMEENSDWINNLWFSDNVQYHLHDYVNSNNCVFWRPEPLQQVLQRPLHSSKVTAWWSINSKTIIGRHWFEDGGEGTGTIKQENNRKVIHKLYASLSRMRDCYQSAMFDARWCHPSYSYCKCNTWTLNT